MKLYESYSQILIFSLYCELKVDDNKVLDLFE